MKNYIKGIKLMKNPITKEGFEELKNKLNYLKNTERIKIINDIKTAREYGDLKENAEYHSAKEAQYLLEKKILEIEKKLIHSTIIEKNILHEPHIVLFGSNITLLHLENKKEYNYTIVGEDEADLNKNKLSITSPLARELMHKKNDAIINLKTPNGIIKYKIINIK